MRCTRTIYITAKAAAGGGNIILLKTSITAAASVAAAVVNKHGRCRRTAVYMHSGDRSSQVPPTGVYISIRLDRQAAVAGQCRLSRRVTVPEAVVFYLP